MGEKLLYRTHLNRASFCLASSVAAASSAAAAPRPEKATPALSSFDFSSLANASLALELVFELLRLRLRLRELRVKLDASALFLFEILRLRARGARERLHALHVRPGALQLLLRLAELLAEVCERVPVRGRVVDLLFELRDPQLERDASRLPPCGGGPPRRPRRDSPPPPRPLSSRGATPGARSCPRWTPARKKRSRRSDASAAAVSEAASYAGAYGFGFDASGFDASGFVGFDASGFVGFDASLDAFVAASASASFAFVALNSRVCVSTCACRRAISARRPSSCVSFDALYASVAAASSPDGRMFAARSAFPRASSASARAASTSKRAASSAALAPRELLLVLLPQLPQQLAVPFAPRHVPPTRRGGGGDLPVLRLRVVPYEVKSGWS